VDALHQDGSPGQCASWYRYLWPFPCFPLGAIRKALRGEPDANLVEAYPPDMSSDKSLEDVIPPDVPVRDTSGRVYCHKQHALDHGVLVRDLAIIVFKERHMEFMPGKHQSIYIGFCEHCGTLI